MIRCAATAHTSRAAGACSANSASGMAASIVQLVSSLAAATYQVGFHVASPQQGVLGPAATIDSEFERSAVIAIRIESKRYPVARCERSASGARGEASAA